MNCRVLISIFLIGFTLHSKGQNETHKEKRGLSVGAFSGIHFPTSENRILGELYSFGIFGEAIYKKNSFGISFGYIGKNTIPASTNFFGTQNNMNYPLNKLTGMILSFDYSREIINANPFFFEGVLSAGYSELEYDFITIEPRLKRSYLFSPGLMSRWIIYESGSGTLYARFKVEYNFVNLSLDETQVNTDSRGDYLSLNFSIGLSVY